MRCYKVTGGGLTQFAATQADARNAKLEIADTTGVKPKEVVVEQTDVPTDKPRLLAFINSLVAGKVEETEDAEEESTEDTRASRRRRRRGG